MNCDQDFAWCTNCEATNRIPVGSDVCPGCNAKGTLQWAEEAPRGVSIDKDKKVNRS